MPTVTRGQAYATAEAYLTAHPVPDCVGISEVYAYDEIDFRRPHINDFPPEMMRGYWIAYAKRPDNSIWVCSSDVILVSKENGSVDFAGCANDEG